ncbi:MAG: NOL1/NOP2/sun family putative RNA methylase [Archaeoglobaceae archaeon]|nr:NOL1/NOP2/sun family putative RNA methylase [Archaeoglobaceae archaeon]MCX8151504.1 NOL1/NOP2/sun family putative RNA methylase [Archaeoglobaceae archaeon]MDW8014020.1 NOL1/NOP2/sun family putative RNA methylase [Archaeoglobaceae archaeon]
MIFDFPSTKISKKIAKKYGYNEFVIRRWLNFFGSEVEKIVEAFEKGIPKYIRINTIKTNDEKILERLEMRGFKLKKTEISYCYEVSVEPYSIGSTPEFLMGYYYVMDKSSCVPPLVLDPKPGEIVLDLAASPGGKTTMLSMLMKNRGVVIAVESKEDRIEPLIDNVHRMGAINVAVIKMDGREIGKLGIEFDKVLLDAPCSGEGVIFKDPERKKTMCAEDIKFCSSLQKELILAAFDVLKPDGILVYSTCTLTPEENEMVVDHLLSKRSAVLEEIPFGDKALNFGNPEVNKARRFYPHKHKTAGFFVAKIRKLS